MFLYWVGLLESARVEDLKLEKHFFRYWTYKIEAIPFRLVNKPVNFQKMMDEVFRGLPFATVYVNDVVIFPKILG